MQPCTKLKLMQDSRMYEHSKMITEYNTCSDYIPNQGDFEFQRPCPTPDDEEMEHLLSKPVTLTQKPVTMTHKQIGEHNLDKTRTDGLWLQHNGTVYDVISLHRQFTEMVAINKGRLPEVCDIGDIINGEDDDDESISDILSTYDLMSAYIDPMERVSYNSIWKCLPSLDLSEEQIKQALEIAYVAHYKELSAEESQAEFQQEVFILRCDIQNEMLTPSLCTLLDILERSVITTGSIPHGLDPNLNPFPLPRCVYGDDLRSWLQSWGRFDTAVTEDIMARTRCYDIILEAEAEEVFLGSLRPYESDVALSHDIEGEAAWDVIEPDVIDDDLCTPQQLERYAKHQNHQVTQGKMKSRREQLADYFLKTHRKKSHCSVWVESMDKCWRDFQDLCVDQK